MTAPSQRGEPSKKALARSAVPHMYQRGGEIIAFARPDLAVAGTGLPYAALVVDIPAMSAASMILKSGHRFSEKILLEQ
jgi:hypothetical protein